MNERSTSRSLRVVRHGLRVCALAMAVFLAGSAIAGEITSKPDATLIATPVALDKLLNPRLREQFPHVRSMLILRDGSPVYEYHRMGLGPDSKHNVASVTKSVTATLVGIAIDQGHLRDASQPLHEVLTEAAAPGMDEKVGSIKLADLLTMSAGFGWDDRRFSRSAWKALPNQLEPSLNRPVVRAHGSVFNYDTPSVHILSVATARSTRTPLETYALKNLFTPLGISNYSWEADAQAMLPAATAWSSRHETWPSWASSTFKAADGKAGSCCRKPM